MHSIFIIRLNILLGSFHLLPNGTTTEHTLHHVLKHWCIPSAESWMIAVLFYLFFSHMCTSPAFNGWVHTALQPHPHRLFVFLPHVTNKHHSLISSSSPLFHKYCGLLPMRSYPQIQGAQQDFPHSVYLGRHKVLFLSIYCFKL